MSNQQVRHQRLIDLRSDGHLTHRQSHFVIREIIRAIQEERKNAGFDVSDRIKLIWNGSAEVSDALESGIKLISEEVLALEVAKDPSLKFADGELELGLKLLRL